MEKIGTAQVGGECVTVLKGQYRTGAAYLQLMCEDGSPYATASVNLPEEVLGEDEVAIKTWSENAALRAPLLATGLLEDTGRRIAMSFCSAEVWRFTSRHAA